ncbi:MAG: GGDEF domain-containing protein [Chloroflexota bacterium]
MFGINHFKQVNHIYGHDTGDKVPQEVTRAACAELRTADIIERFGGEEFIILLPMTSAQQAHPSAEHIRLEVEGRQIPGTSYIANLR